MKYLGDLFADRLLGTNTPLKVESGSVRGPVIAAISYKTPVADEVQWKISDITNPIQSMIFSKAQEDTDEISW